MDIEVKNIFEDRRSLWPAQLPAFFTTHLRRAGMRREFIQELRGDSRREAIDIYDHIDFKELKEAYLACIPKLVSEGMDDLFG